MPAATCSSSTQSPTRTAATGPPLAARMTATRVRACCPVCSPTRPCVHDPASAANAARVAGAGHLGGQPASCRGETQQPAQAGPDHIGADQHQQPRAQMRQLRPGGRPRPPAGQPTRRDHVPPVGLVFRAAGLPPLLPAVTGVGLQPGQHGQHPQPAGLLAGRVVQRERRGQHPGQHRGSARLGRRPRRRDRARRERGQQLRPGRASPARSPATRPRSAGAVITCCAAAAVTTRPRRTGSAGSRPGIPAPAAQPGRGRGRRAWKASTPAITSSVTGFR